MLSYNNSSNIRNIFRQYKIKTIETTYEHTSHISKRKVKELVITNY
jgi:putative IMPACT (imprinted ancient) family translation regulator